MQFETAWPGKAFHLMYYCTTEFKSDVEVNISAKDKDVNVTIATDDWEDFKKRKQKI